MRTGTAKLTLTLKDETDTEDVVFINLIVNRKIENATDYAAKVSTFLFLFFFSFLKFVVVLRIVVYLSKRVHI